MKKWLIVLLAGTLYLPFVMHAQQMKIATYNLRYDNPADSGNRWADRVHHITGLIRYHAFDIMGTQEGLIHQLDQLQSMLNEYAYYGIGRDDGKQQGEFSAIFYRRARFDRIDQGDFWLAETPEKPSKGWDAQINRICTWVKLADKETGCVFYVFNAHYDHRGLAARKNSSQLLLKKIPEIAHGDPFILTGDFNGNQQSEWYTMLQQSGVMHDAYTLAADPYAPNGTFNGFLSSGVQKDIIDHIFVTPLFKVKSYGILTDSYFGKFPSDHFPVCITVIPDKGQ